LNACTLILAAGALFWEGLICLAMMLPLTIVLAMLGGIAGGFCARRFGKSPLVCVALLPFITASLEHQIGPRWEVRDVRTSIVIAASPSIIWDNIARVRPFQPGEQQFSWTQTIGFPRPLEATLSDEGVGAVRHATFAGGVLFL